MKFFLIVKFRLYTEDTRQGQTTTGLHNTMLDAGKLFFFTNFKIPTFEKLPTDILHLGSLSQPPPSQPKIKDEPKIYFYRAHRSSIDLLRYHRKSFADDLRAQRFKIDNLFETGFRVFLYSHFSASTHSQINPYRYLYSCSLPLTQFVYCSKYFCTSTQLSVICVS